MEIWILLSSFKVVRFWNSIVAFYAIQPAPGTLGGKLKHRYNDGWNRLIMRTRWHICAPARGSASSRSTSAESIAIADICSWQGIAGWAGGARSPRAHYLPHVPYPLVKMRSSVSTSEARESYVQHAAVAVSFQNFRRFCPLVYFYLGSLENKIRNVNRFRI
jgi:hypothetical protein